MSRALLGRLPALTSTGVGSLPFTEPEAAVAHAMAAYGLPFCPQLPRLEGDMIQEWLGIDPGRCGWAPDRDRERPAAWEAFVARLREAPPSHRVVKLQVTGPVTLAIALERAVGRPGCGGAVRDVAVQVAAWLGASAAAQARTLAGLGLATLLLVDEPGLAGAGLAASAAAVWDPLRAAADAWGLHVCGVVPWGLVDAAEPDALSFDLMREPLRPEACAALTRLVLRGGRVIWGIVDPIDPGTAEAAATRLTRAIDGVSSPGAGSFNEVAAASLISPACGTGRLSVAGEQRAASTLSAVVARLPVWAGHAKTAL